MQHSRALDIEFSLPIPPKKRAQQEVLRSQRSRPALRLQTERQTHWGLDQHGYSNTVRSPTNSDITPPVSRFSPENCDPPPLSSGQSLHPNRTRQDRSGGSSNWYNANSPGKRRNERSEVSTGYQSNINSPYPNQSAVFDYFTNPPISLPLLPPGSTGAEGHPFPRQNLKNSRSQQFRPREGEGSENGSRYPSFPIEKTGSAVAEQECPFPKQSLKKLKSQDFLKSAAGDKLTRREQPQQPNLPTQSYKFSGAPTRNINSTPVEKVQSGKIIYSRLYNSEECEKGHQRPYPQQRQTSAAEPENSFSTAQPIREPYTKPFSFSNRESETMPLGLSNGPPEELFFEVTQIYVLRLYMKAHEACDRLEYDPNFSKSLLLEGSYHYRFSKRPNRLIYSWEVLCDRSQMKSRLRMEKYFDALSAFIESLSYFKHQVNAGITKISPPIDRQWVKAMLLDAKRAYDDLVYIEETHRPPGGRIVKREKFDDPDLPTSRVGCPSPKRDIREADKAQNISFIESVNNPPKAGQQLQKKPSFIDLTVKSQNLVPGEGRSAHQKKPSSNVSVGNDLIVEHLVPVEGMSRCSLDSGSESEECKDQEVANESSESQPVALDWNATIAALVSGSALPEKGKGKEKGDGIQDFKSSNHQSRVESDSRLSAHERVNLGVAELQLNPGSLSPGAMSTTTLEASSSYINATAHMLSLQNQPEEEESVTSIVANAIILARECANARHESWMKQNMDSPYPVLVKNMRADVPPLSRNTLIDTPQQIPAKPPLRLQKMTEEAAAGKGPRPLTRQNSDPKNPSPLSQSLSLEDLEIEQSQPQTFGNATPITPNLPANEIEFHLNRGYIAAALDTDDMMSDLSDEERNNGEEPARETGSQVAATLTGALSRTFSFVKNKAKPIGTPGPSKAAGPSIPSLPTIPPTPLSYFAPSTLTMSSTNTSVSPLSPSGSFEVGGYETQQYPLGNFENGGFVTKLCHHESSYDQAEVDSKRISGEKVKKIIAKLLKRENSM